MNARLKVLLLRPRTEPAGEWANYGDGHKLLSDNRRLYLIQSERTKDGKRAEFEEADCGEALDQC